MSSKIPYLTTAHLGGVGEWGLCDDDDSSVPNPVVAVPKQSHSTNKIHSSERRAQDSNSPSKPRSSKTLDAGLATPPPRKSVASAMSMRRSALDAPASAPAKTKRTTTSKPTSSDADFLLMLESPVKEKRSTPTKLALANRDAPRQDIPHIVANLKERSESASITSETANWVEEYLEAASLTWAVSLFAELQFSLELVPFLDSDQLDDIFALTKFDSRVNNNDINDGGDGSFDLTVEKVKLLCALRATRVHLEAAGRMKRLETLEQRNISGSSPLMESTDVKSWSVATVGEWLASVPVLKHLAGIFVSNNIDGSVLLRLHERKLIQQLRIGSPVDRRLLLQHIADLTTLQSSSAFVIAEKVQKLQPSSRSSRPKATVATEAHSAPTTPSKTASAQQTEKEKKAPNFFISLRIDNKQLQSMVRDLQDEIVKEIPLLQGSKCILDPSLLHFTVGRLHLDTPEDEERAKEILREAESIKNRVFGQGRPVSITFKGIANHGGNAVFVETEMGQDRDNLTEFGNSVFELFREAGLASRNFRFIPVAPIVRIHSNKKEAVAPLKELCATRLVPHYETKVLGRHTFASLEISSVSPEHHTGYYDALSSCAL